MRVVQATTMRKERSVRRGVGAGPRQIPVLAINVGSWTQSATLWADLSPEMIRVLGKEGQKSQESQAHAGVALIEFKFQCGTQALARRPLIWLGDAVQLFYEVRVRRYCTTVLPYRLYRR